MSYIAFNRRIKRLFGKNWLAYLIWVAAGAQLRKSMSRESVPVIC